MMRASEVHNKKTALVLPGGGARGAFQVGVLKAISELLPNSKARRFALAVAELEQVWGNFHCDQVYRTDNVTMLKSSAHWLASVVLGGFLVGMPKSLLDNSPLRALAVSMLSRLLLRATHLLVQRRSSRRLKVKRAGRGPAELVFERN